MRDAEGVVDVGILALDELEDERRVVGLLALGETQVFQQFDPVDSSSAVPHGPEIEVGVDLALGTTEVRTGGDLSSVVTQPLQGGQGRTDPEVVSDDTFALWRLCYRDVEVDPNQNVLSLQVPEIL